MIKIKKIIRVLYRFFLCKLIYVNLDLYMQLYTRFLKKIGIQIIGIPKFINPDVYFDGNNYNKIILGDNITISREVMFLTHDYSITTALASIGQNIGRYQGELYISKEIKIGNNCFIGARSSLLPGTILGNNVIVGAGAVVRGVIPDNCIVIGNPCEIISKTNDWVERKLSSNELKIEK